MEISWIFIFDSNRVLGMNACRIRNCYLKSFSRQSLGKAEAVFQRISAQVKKKLNVNHILTSRNLPDILPGIL